MRIFSSAVLFVAVFSSSMAVAAPKGLYGKSVTVSWTETRSQRHAGQTAFRPVSLPFTYTVYVSSEGRPFKRLTSVSANRRATGTKDRVGWRDRGPKQFGRHAVRRQQDRFEHGSSGGYGRRIEINLDSGFRSCSAKVISGKSPGKKVASMKSVATGNIVEFESISAGPASCSDSNRKCVCKLRGLVSVAGRFNQHWFSVPISLRPISRVDQTAEPPHHEASLPEVPVTGLTHRQSEIFNIARAFGRVMVDDLARRFEVSAQTIRKDLNDLCDHRSLTRIHGGAIIASGVENLAYEARRFVAAEEKKAIGAAAAALIPNGCSLFINIGTTTEEVASALTSHEDLLVITNNLNVAMLLYRHPRIEVIVAGGAVRRADGAVIGSTAISLIGQFKVDYAIIGASAIDEEGALLDFDYREVQAAQAIIANARSVMLVADRPNSDAARPCASPISARSRPLSPTRPCRRDLPTSATAGASRWSPRCRSRRRYRRPGVEPASTVTRLR